MTNPFADLRASRTLRGAVQVAIIAALVVAWLLHEHSIDTLRADEQRADATATAVQAILADACGSVDFATLQAQGLVAECRLARNGDMDAAVARYLAAHPTKPQDVPGNIVPDSPTSSPAPASRGSIDAAVSDWFANHDLPLRTDYLTALRGAVADRLRTHPPKPGRPPTKAEIAAAVAAYLTSHPPRDGSAGRGVSSAALDGCGVVFTYTDGSTDRVGPICGADGKDATDAQVADAVAAYCADRDNCRGPKGDPGYPTSFTLENGEVCSDPDGDHAYTCERPKPGQPTESPTPSPILP